MTLSVTCFPSTFTVMTAVPALLAVIRPEADTGAIVTELEEYVTALFVALSGRMIGAI